jgi:hypothetical protein
MSRPSTSTKFERESSAMHATTQRILGQLCKATVSLLAVSMLGCGASEGTVDEGVMDTESAVRKTAFQDSGNTPRLELPSGARWECAHVKQESNGLKKISCSARAYGEDYTAQRILDGTDTNFEYSLVRCGTCSGAFDSCPKGKPASVILSIFSRLDPRAHDMVSYRSKELGTLGANKSSEWRTIVLGQTGCTKSCNVDNNRSRIDETGNACWCDGQAYGCTH